MTVAEQFRSNGSIDGSAIRQAFETLSLKRNDAREDAECDHEEEIVEGRLGELEFFGVVLLSSGADGAYRTGNIDAGVTQANAAERCAD